WLDATEAAGGLLSVNHPFAGPVSWTRPMRRRPPLIEAWHWSWLDLRWTTPLSWWLAWDPAAIPVGGSDWHRPGSDAPPGRCPRRGRRRRPDAGRTAGAVRPGPRRPRHPAGIARPAPPARPRRSCAGAVWLDAVWLDAVWLTGGQEALAGCLVKDGGGRAGG